MPSIADVKIPDLAAAKTTLKFVCIGVAPKASEPCMISLSTDLIATSLIEVIVGIVMIAKTITAANIELPPFD